MDHVTLLEYLSYQQSCKRPFWCAAPHMSSLLIRTHLTLRAEPESVKCGLLHVTLLVSIASNRLRSQFIWPRCCSCLWCDVTRLLGCPLWKTSIWNMSSALCLLLPFPLSCERALHRLMAFSDGTMCYLLLTTGGLHSAFWYPAICLSLSCLLCYPTSFSLLHSSGIPGRSTLWKRHRWRFSMRRKTTSSARIKYLLPSMVTLWCLFRGESRLQLVGNNLFLGKHVNPGHAVRYASDTSANDLFSVCSVQTLVCRHHFGTEIPSNDGCNMIYSHLVSFHLPFI